MNKVFGTDGIRGIANVYPITPETALRVGKAVAQMFREKGKNERNKIIIGKDTRLSGYMIEMALAAGISSMGADPILVGVMPTPAIAHLTKSMNADAGIVISASHNPSEHNGIKIFTHDGYKLDDDVEAEMEKFILADEMKSEHVRGEDIGKAFRVADARGRYIAFAKNSIRNASLKDFTIVLDCANGAGYKVGPAILRELGAKVVVMNNQPDGRNINANCGALHPESMKKAVLDNKADIGIALDGDADRIAVVDESGSIVDGDQLIAMCALDLHSRGLLKNDTVVSTVMANKGFDVAMEKNGIKVVKTKVGDRYVMGAMQSGDYVLGGEQSGHIIFLEYGTTGDGIISGLQVVDLIKRSGKKLSELAKCMDRFPQVLINVDVKEKKDIEELASVVEVINDVEKELGDRGRTLVRYSGTENLCRILVEGEDEAKVRELASKIASAVREELG